MEMDLDSYILDCIDKLLHSAHHVLMREQTRAKGDREVVYKLKEYRDT
jgi:hypothetical protein